MQRFNGKVTNSGQVLTSGLSSTNTADLTFASATVSVNIVGGGLAAIFSDNASPPTPLANPFTANVDATFAFYAANGRYTITITGGGLGGPVTTTDVLLSDALAVSTSAAFVTTTRGDRQIIVQNPDFEGSSILPPPGWFIFFGTVTLSYDTVTQAPGKLQSLKMVNTLGGGAELLSSTSYSVIPGDTYALQAAVKTDGTNPVQVELRMGDKNNARVGPVVGTQVSTSAGWTTLFANVTVPAGACQMQIGLACNSTGTVWFDEICVQKISAPGTIQTGAFSPTTGDRQPILANPQFDVSGQILPPPGWTLGGSGVNGNLVASYETSTPAPGKAQSIKLVCTSPAPNGIVQLSKYSVFPGDTYSIAAMAKSDGTGSATIIFDIRDKNNVEVAFAVASTTSTSWTELRANVVIPATAVNGFVAVYNNVANSTVWFDEVCVQKTNFPGPFNVFGVQNGSTGFTSGLATPTQTALGYKADINGNLGTGSANVFGVLSLVHASADIAGDRVYGGFFKVTAQNRADTQIGLHVETVSAAPALIAEFVANAVQAMTISSNGTSIIGAGVQSPLQVFRSDAGNAFSLFGGGISSSGAGIAICPLFGGTSIAWFVATNQNKGQQLEFIHSTVAGGTTPAATDAFALDTSGNGIFAGTVTTTAVLGPGLQKQIFTSSGTFTIPAGITQVRVTVIGAGGSGGGVGTTAQTTAMGGGSGGWGRKWLTGLTPGNTLAVTVGTGGAGASNGTNPGGNSQVASGTQTITTILANGGAGGGSNAGTTGQTGAAGGATGSGGDENYAGNDSNGAPGSASQIGGNGAPSVLGGSTRGATTGNTGNTATVAGAGGSGCVSAGAALAGGSGANGLVIFEWVS